MGEPDEVWEERIKDLTPYRVTKHVMENANGNAILAGRAVNCDPVACLCLAAKNTNMVIHASFWSFLEYQIAWLRICLTDYIGLSPLIRSAIPYTCFHSLVLVAIHYCPGNKTAAVKAIST